MEWIMLVLCGTVIKNNKTYFWLCFLNNIKNDKKIIKKNFTFALGRLSSSYQKCAVARSPRELVGNQKFLCFVQV